MPLTAFFSTILSPSEFADWEIGFGTSFADVALSLAPIKPAGAEHPDVIALATLDYAHVVVMLAYALTAASCLPGFKTRAKCRQA